MVLASKKHKCSDQAVMHHKLKTTKPLAQWLCTSLLVASVVSASLASAQGISGIGAFAPNTELGFAPVAAAGEPRINWINGEYQETNKDLSVKVLGGTLDIARSWSQGRWWLNPAWAPLNFELDPLGADVKVIERVGVIYERIGQSGQSALYMAKSKGNAPVYIKKLVDAAQPPAQQHTGWQWYDRFGNTITYDKDGRILNYANASGVKVSFAYDTTNTNSATSARILDHFGKTIYTVIMANGLITKVDDLAGRSVSYQWTGTQLTQVTDVMGNLWKYEYDGNGQITSRTDPVGFKTTVQYSQSIKAPEPMLALGKKGTTIDPAGTSGTTQKLANIWGGGRVGRFDGQSGCSATGANHYLREQRVFEVTYTDCRGNATVYIYDLQGNELNRTFNGKKTASNQWDGAYSQKYTNARGYSTTTTYDTNYQPLQITHPDGSVEKYTYEPVFGRQSSYTNQLGVVSTWRYDSKGNVTEWVEAKGLPEQRTTVYTYDQYGQLTSTTKGAADAKQQDAITQSWQYDSAGNVTAQTDGEGNTRKMAYDLRGAPTSRTDALNRTTSFTFDAAGNLTKTTNPLGNATQMRYDARGRRTHTITPMGNTSVTRYDEKGRIVEILAPGETEGAGRRTVYDSNGWPIQSISPSGLITETTYDNEGRTKSSKDPAGNVTSYEYGVGGTAQAGQLTAAQYPTYKETYQYDQQGRQITVTQHLENSQPRTQSQTYDALGQRVASTDPAGRTILGKYDALGRPILITDPVGNVTSQNWNAHDQLIAVTDANGNTHRFDYDKTGGVTKETRPMGGTIQYSYDAVGQLIKRTDAGQNTRDYSYSAAGLIVTEEHNLQGTQTDQRISYRYNADGQLSGYEQKDGNNVLISSASYTKDDRGRTTQSQITYGKVNGTGSFSFTIGQGFNADDQLASQTYPEGSSGTFSYDKGQLARVTLPNQSVITYGNYLWQMPTKIKTPGATKVLSFDALQRPLSIEVINSMSTAPLASRYYRYDQAGNIVQTKSDLGQTQYGYDNLDRLIKAQPDESLQKLGLPIEQYTYDLVHNRTSSAHQPGTWNYNADNQLTRYPYLKPFTLEATPLDTTVNFTPQGHTSLETNAQEEKRYVYNAAERLVEYKSTRFGDAIPSIKAQYRYDPMGRRISKSITDAQQSGTSTTYFVYTDAGLMGELNGLGELTRAYGFNPNMAEKGLWSTEPLWQADKDIGKGQKLNLANDNDAVYQYLQTDYLGTPMLAVNNVGDVSWSVLMEAFGSANVNSSAFFEMNLRFPGQYFDVESNLQYNYRRDYLSYRGVYLQSDPISIRGGINFYEYSRNNPNMIFDSNGLISSVQGYSHYCGRSGTDLSMNFSEINFSGAEGEIRNKIVEKIGSNCTERKIPFYWVRSFNASGDDFFLIGSLSVKIDGNISVKCDCSWSFSASMESAVGYDLYDFNKANRGFIGETLTAIGRNVCDKGVDYKIHLLGKSQINQNGIVRFGKNTCCGEK